MAIDISSGVTLIGDSVVAVATIGVAVLGVVVLTAAFKWIRCSVIGGESDDTIPCTGCAGLFPESELDEDHFCVFCYGYESDDTMPCARCGVELTAEEAAWSECPYCGHDTEFT